MSVVSAELPSRGGEEFSGGGHAFLESADARSSRSSVICRRAGVVIGPDANRVARRANYSPTSAQTALIPFVYQVVHAFSGHAFPLATNTGPLFSGGIGARACLQSFDRCG